MQLRGTRTSTNHKEISSWGRLGGLKALEAAPDLSPSNTRNVLGSQGMLPVCGTDRVGGQPQRLCSFPAPFVAPLPHHGPRTPQHGDTECSWSAESPQNRRGTDSPGGWKQVSFWGGNLSTQPFLSSGLFFSRSPLSHYFMVCQHLPATCLRNSILLPTGRPEPY